VLTRGPILVPLGAFQNVLVSHLVHRADHGLRTLRHVARFMVPVAVAVIIAAAVLGPPLLSVLRPGFNVSSAMFAAMTASAALLAVLTITGAATLAFDHHRAYSVGWVTATVVAVAMLLLPATLEWRVALSLLAAPLAGIAIHGRTLRQRRPVGRRDALTVSGSVDS
jgi:hypothetical protein